MYYSPPLFPSDRRGTLRRTNHRRSSIEDQSYCSTLSLESDQEEVVTPLDLTALEQLPPQVRITMEQIKKEQVAKLRAIRMATSHHRPTASPDRPDVGTSALGGPKIITPPSHLRVGASTLNDPFVTKPQGHCHNTGPVAIKNFIFSPYGDDSEASSHYGSRFIAPPNRSDTETLIRGDSACMFGGPDQLQQEGSGSKNPARGGWTPIAPPSDRESFAIDGLTYLTTYPDNIQQGLTRIIPLGYGGLTSHPPPNSSHADASAIDDLQGVYFTDDPYFTDGPDYFQQGLPNDSRSGYNGLKFFAPPIRSDTKNPVLGGSTYMPGDPGSSKKKKKARKGRVENPPADPVSHLRTFMGDTIADAYTKEHLANLKSSDSKDPKSVGDSESTTRKALRKTKSLFNLKKHSLPTESRNDTMPTFRPTISGPIPIPKGSQTSILEDVPTVTMSKAYEAILREGMSAPSIAAGDIATSSSPSKGVYTPMKDRVCAPAKDSDRASINSSNYSGDETSVCTAAAIQAQQARIVDIPARKKNLTPRAKLEGYE